MQVAPECSIKEGIILHLNTKFNRNPEKAEPIRSINSSALKKSGLQFQKPIKIITHGFIDLISQEIWKVKFQLKYIQE